MIFQRRGVGIFAIILQLRGYSPANPHPKNHNMPAAGKTFYMYPTCI